MGRALTDASNIIGTVILAFVGHGETWSVVRVYDKSAAAQMVGGWFTTEMVFLASASTPLFIDHLALVPVAR